jgi:hypothetical protein
MSDAAIGLLGVGIGAVIGFVSSFVTARMGLRAQASENDKLIDAQWTESRRQRQHAAYTGVLEAFYDAVEKAAQFASVHLQLGYPQEDRGTDDDAKQRRETWATYSLDAWRTRSRFKVAYTNALLVAGKYQSPLIESLDHFLESEIYTFQPFVNHRRDGDTPVAQIPPSGLAVEAAKVANNFAENLSDQL